MPLKITRVKPIRLVKRMVDVREAKLLDGERQATDLRVNIRGRDMGREESSRRTQ